MTQFENPYAGDSASAVEVKTSGLAITSLVLSLVCCLPVTTIPGALLGLVSAVKIAGNPARKGMGIAIAAVVLGVLFTVGQVVIGTGIYAGYKVFRDAPAVALEPGFAGDLAAFKTNFNAGSAPDIEAQAFLDAVTSRYGALDRAEVDFQAFQSMQQPAPGATLMTLPWTLVFEGGTRVEAKLTFDQMQQPQPDQLTFTEIRIVDAAQGDLVFPAGVMAPGGADGATDASDDAGAESGTVEEPDGG